jgi:hypothetical protein
MADRSMNRRGFFIGAFSSIVLLTGCSRRNSGPEKAVREFYIAANDGNVNKTRQLTLRDVEADNELTDISVETVEERSFDEFYDAYDAPQSYNDTLRRFRTRGNEFEDWQMVYYSIMFGETEYEGYWQTVKTEDGWRLANNYNIS